MWSGKDPLKMEGPREVEITRQCSKKQYIFFYYYCFVQSQGFAASVPSRFVQRFTLTKASCSRPLLLWFEPIFIFEFTHLFQALFDVQFDQAIERISSTGPSHSISFSVSFIFKTITLF